MSNDEQFPQKIVAQSTICVLGAVNLLTQDVESNEVNWVQYILLGRIQLGPKYQGRVNWDHIDSTQSFPSHPIYCKIKALQAFFGQYSINATESNVKNSLNF